MPTFTDIRREYLKLSARVNYGAFDGHPASADERLRLQELSSLMVQGSSAEFAAMVQAIS